MHTSDMEASTKNFFIKRKIRDLFRTVLGEIFIKARIPKEFSFEFHLSYPTDVYYPNYLKEGYYIMLYNACYYDSSTGECTDEEITYDHDEVFVFFEKEFGYINYKETPLKILDDYLLLITCELGGG